MNLIESFHPPAGYHAAAPGDEPFTVSGFDVQRIVFNGKIYQPASEGDRWDVTMLGRGSAGSFTRL